ncbi:hypothetical protein P692DRAFT_20291905 [Suillus brevipes Sb2]|nr:hypothetical protein P692DRAFT_20291905 [Suillus brevipes Sb2]
MGRMLGPRRCELHLFTPFATRLHQRQLLGEEGRAASTALGSPRRVKSKSRKDVGNLVCIAATTAAVAAVAQHFPCAPCNGVFVNNTVLLDPEIS